LHHLSRFGLLHPRREIPEISEEDGHLLETTGEVGSARQNLIPDLLGHVLAKCFPDDLTLPQAVEHAVETLGDGTNFIVGDDWAAPVESPEPDVRHRLLDLRQGIRHAMRRKNRQPDR
jgi:hypothetical protein